MLDYKTTPENAWSEFLSFVQEKCDVMEYKNWISPIGLMQASEEGIVLSVPNVFVQEYLLENFKEELVQFFPLSSDGKVAVSFIIKEPEKKVASVKPAPRPQIPYGLNQLYTFDNYIEGPSNQFVKSAAFGVASRPGKSYNPLVIHGGVGLGKTHLLHGIGHYALLHHKKLKVKCVTTEAFINDLVDHLRSKSVDRMKKYYRSLDILLIDDIHFLQNRPSFEEEFCVTFESLINEGRQVVIISDKPPSELRLSERLIARMEWGLVANVMAPDLETRVAIVQYKAQNKGLNLTNDVAFFIAEHIYNNVRQIEGAVNRLSAYAKLMNFDLSVDMVEKVLSHLFQKSPHKKITIEQILTCVGAIFEVKISELKSTSRHKHIAKARQSAMYLAKEHISDSLTKIAAHFGKTHSTLLHAWKTVKKEMGENPVWKRQIEMAERQLKKPQAS